MGVCYARLVIARCADVRIDAVIAAGALPRLVDLFGSPDADTRRGAVAIVSNLSAGDSECAGCAHCLLGTSQTCVLRRRAQECSCNLGSVAASRGAVWVA